MYKTVRHGENSLQYTILPQNDDYRGVTIGGDGQKRSTNRTCRHNRKKSIVAYVGLFFVCAVITGAILVPLMVTSDLMPSPTSWFYKAQKARELRNPVSVKYLVEKQQNGVEEDQKKLNDLKNNHIDISQNVTEFDGNLDDGNAINTKTSSLSLIASTEESFSISSTTGDIIQTTIKVTPSTIISTQPLLKTTEILTTTTTATTPTITTTTTTTEVPNVSTTSSTTSSTKGNPRFPNKPVIVVDQQSEKVAIKAVDNLVDQERSTDEKNWLQSHWPYVDPSTYFQWVGYNTEDRVILPIILGAALILIFIIALLCMMARRKGACKACAKKRGRNAFEKIEPQGEDNTTLLTTENQSEEE